MSSFESSISYTYKFRDQIKGTFRSEGRGKSISGKKFSPAPGYFFQLRIFNLDTEKFCVYLENCSEEKVLILEYLVHHPDSAGNFARKAVNFSLQPQDVMGLPGFEFVRFGRPRGSQFHICFNHNSNFFFKSVNKIFQNCLT